MSAQSKRELVERIKELEDENDDLRGRLDDVADIVGADDDEEEGEDGDEGED